MTSPYDRTAEDVGNIVKLEHVNVTIPDQRLATLFYVKGLGFTRDPYLMVELDNMWINIGRNQMHLPTGEPQRLRGTIGLVVPDVAELKARLERVRPALAGTAFSFADRDAFVETTCPWGNRFRCHAPGAEFGDMELGMPYVAFDVPVGSAAKIARFYREIMGAAGEIVDRDGAPAAAIRAGDGQHFYFRETSAAIPPYDGHHMQLYISDFSGPYRRLIERHLITRETDAHEWRFIHIVDLDNNEPLFAVEHEVRSLRHPLYGRPLVNRNTAQTNRAYLRGQDAFRGRY
jgi:catechol 2,3-dioxygenase-like lactoylglutathione lyase family enzyme